MDSAKDNTVADLAELFGQESITVTGNDTITLNSFSGGPHGYVPSNMAAQFPNAHWTGSSITAPQTITTVSNGTTYSTNTTAPWMTWNPNSLSSKIQLDGAEADITVRGWSLVAAVKRIEERLGLYQPNPELESEWEELRDLAQQYQKLEQHIRDKQATFDRIKAMPAPNIE